MVCWVAVPRCATRLAAGGVRAIQARHLDVLAYYEHFMAGLGEGKDITKKDEA